MSSASLVDPLPAKKKKNDKRGPLPGIWSAKDGPGPAKWRRDNTGVHGQVRRKGERDPKKGGLRMSREMANTPRYKNAQGLPPLDPKVREQREKRKEAAKKEGEKGAKQAERERKEKKRGKNCALM